MTTSRWRALASAVAVTGSVALVPAASAPAGPAVPGARPGSHAYAVRQACPPARRPGWTSCLALARTDIRGHTGTFGPRATPAGYGPADLRSAYSLPSATAGSGETVAIVDAYDDPHAEADLQIYRRQYGLPPCTTANRCFTKVNQAGQQGNYPAPDAGWAQEESLDLDMVSAVCPRCRILLVEAGTARITDLGTAENEAVALGAKYVSNSWGTTGEPRGATGWDHYFNHPGVAVTVSAGDRGYGVSYPAASRYVTSVGGTSLRRDAHVPRGWAETAWGSRARGNGTGSGCSKYEPKPPWQQDAGCAERTVADVSADADPATGVSAYDSYQGQGWYVFGGTSVSSPVIASAFALAGRPVAGTYPSSYPYAGAIAAPNAVNDITSGANGTCSPAYLCTAGPGYDGPTGVGTPEGTAAFGYRQYGTVAGTVRDAATGRPIPGVLVSVPGMSVMTGSTGAYSLKLPVASYRLTAADYGYQTRAVAATVTANTTTTRDFMLAPAPRASVSGAVTDGSGQGWPLYARLTWSDRTGHGGTTFTSPATGGYALSLLANASYTLRVTAIYPGYEPVSRTITLGSSGLPENFPLTVDPLTCSAPGYHPVTSGVTQPFAGMGSPGAHPPNRGTLQSFAGRSAPRGWTVRNADLLYPGYSYRPGWVFGDPGHRGNHTGGAGGFAIVDSAFDGAHHYQDTYLTSPVTDMSAYKSPELAFGTDLRPAVNSVATVRLSTDSGRSWQVVWRNARFPGVPGPAEVVLALRQALGKSHVRIRFGYLGEWSGYWEIDNVFLGNRVCARQSGALLTGRVTSAASGAAINGATVASVTHPPQRAVTVATPGDSAINGGFYWLFTTATGSRRFTASMTGYATGTRTVTVPPGKVTSLNFPLTSSG